MIERKTFRPGRSITLKELMATAEHLELDSETIEIDIEYYQDYDSYGDGHHVVELAITGKTK